MVDCFHSSPNRHEQHMEESPVPFVIHELWQTGSADSAFGHIAHLQMGLLPWTCSCAGSRGFLKRHRAWEAALAGHVMWMVDPISMLQNEQCSLPHYPPASLICSLFQSNCLCLDIYLCWTASAQINEHAAHWLGSTYRVKYHLMMWCPNGDLNPWFQHKSRNFHSISCCQNEPHNKPCNVMCIHMISNNSLSPWEDIKLHPKAVLQ